MFTPFTTPLPVRSTIAYLNSINGGGRYFYVKMEMKDGQRKEEFLGKFDGKKFFPLNMDNLGLECQEESYLPPIPVESIHSIYGVEVNGEDWPILKLLQKVVTSPYNLCW
jgi:hypothetical protein